MGSAMAAYVSGAISTGPGMYSLGSGMCVIWLFGDEHFDAE